MEQFRELLLSSWNAENFNVWNVEFGSSARTFDRASDLDYA